MSSIFVLISNFFSSIFIGVINEAFKTPAVEISVEDEESDIDIVATDADDILSELQYWDKNEI